MPGMRANLVKRIEQLGDPAVGGVNAVGGNIFPDVLKIQDCLCAENVVAHARGFRRCSDLRSRRARASAG